MTISLNASISARATPRRDAQRRFVVRAVFFIFLLSLIEGPLRKWFLPGLSGPLTLLRDPFVIALYAYCFLTKRIMTQGLAEIWLWFGALTSVLGGFQYLFAGLPAWGWVLGVRSYWLYMPLAFVIAENFRRDDVHTFIKMCLLIAIPYSLLMAAQYSSPSNAFVNRGVGGDEQAAVGVSDGLFRPFGLFTYTGPNVQFTAFMIAMFVAFVVSNMKIYYRSLALIVCGAAVGTMSILTGSRSIYFLAASVFGITTLGLLFARPTQRNLIKVVTILGFIGGVAVLFILVFPDMLSAMFNRFERAAKVEGSILDRAFGGLFAWVDPLFRATIFGQGIGAGAPGVARQLGLQRLAYGESDLQRNIFELGLLLGSAMIGLRVFISIHIVSKALKLAKYGIPIMLPVAGYAFFPFLMGQITHSPLNAFLPWISLGLTLAALSDAQAQRSDLRFRSRRM